MKKKINNILITNDDGFDAIGIKLLLEIAEKLGKNVFVIAGGVASNLSIRKNLTEVAKEKNFTPIFLQ